MKYQVLTIQCIYEVMMELLTIKWRILELHALGREVIPLAIAARLHDDLISAWNAAPSIHTH